MVQCQRKKHRIDGPAIEWSNGTKYWYIDGKKHRKDGPAIEYNDGYKSWWIEGKEYTEERFNNVVRNRRWKQKMV